MVQHEIRKNPNLRYSVYDAIAWAFMFGFAEMYIAPFSIFLNATPQQVGFLTTFPPLLGSLAQFVGLYLTERYNDRRLIICTGVWFQAFTLSLLALLPLILPFLTAPYVLLVALICIYHATGNMGTPAWHSLVGELIPQSIRINFLAHRNSRVAIYTFMAYAIGGIILDRTEHWSRLTCGYATIFALAAFGRFLSFAALARHENPNYNYKRRNIFSLKPVWQTVSATSYGRFIMFFCLIHFGANIAGPYFGLYLLRDLEMSYLNYTILIGIQVFCQFLSLRFWAWLGKDIGTTKLLVLSGYAVSILPFLWIFSADMSYLMVVQIFSGVFWAGFNLASQNYLFKNLATDVRAQISAYQLVLNALFVFLGSSLGGITIKYADALGVVGSQIYQFSSPIFVVFFISGMIRLCTARFLRPLSTPQQH